MNTSKGEASKSIIWSAIERFSVQGIQMILTIIIARVLLPEDYGLIAMLSIFMAIAQSFIDSGFSNALTQKLNRTNTDFCTVFYFNIAVSVIFYLLLYVSSPFIADFYNQPKLDGITKVYALVIVINSLGAIQQSKLIINLDFKRLAKASLIAVISSGIIGVYLAYTGWGVWALVIQSVLNSLFNVLVLWISSKWIPSLIFSMTSFKTLFKFGSKLLGASLLHTLYVNLYTLIIGKFFSADICGLYNQSYKLSSFPSQNLSSIIIRAVYPIQCRIQDKTEELREMYMKYLKMSCFVIFPIMVLLCAIAKPLVLILLKEQWLDIVPIFQILCIAFMWDPVMKFSSSIVNVKGKSDYFLKAEIFKKLVAFGLLFGTIPLGIEAMCVGLIVYSFADIAIMSYFTNKVIGFTFFDQLKALTPITLISAVSGICSYMATLSFENKYLSLLSGVAIFILIILLLFSTNKNNEYKIFINLVFHRK